MFITFEGIDGSGKSTQIELLRDRLLEAGEEVEVFREPGGTDLSEEIRNWLLSTEMQIDPVAELFLFSAARAQLVAERLLPLLNKGGVVLLDRFYDSTTAYQGYGRGSATLKQISVLNELASHQRAPDITIYLRIDLKSSKARTESVMKDRMEKSGDDFFKRVIEGFDRLGASEQRIVTIDSARPVEDVHREIWDTVASRL